MILECGHCGAPFEVKEDSTLVRCVYCRVTTERTRVRTLHPKKPADFAPPIRWTPPAHVPADSNVTLAYRAESSSAGWLVAAVVIAVLGAVVGLVVAKQGGKAGFSGVATKELAKVRLVKGPATIGAKLGANVSETSIYVRLDDPRYEALSMSWDKGHPEAPRSFNFGVKKGSGVDPAAIARLSKHLRGGLDKNRSWSWEGVSLHMNADGHFNGSVRIERSAGKDNPHWQEQIDALFRVVITDVLGVKGVAISDDELRLLLAFGYPLDDIGKFDPQTPVDLAEDAVLAKFPGAQQVSGSGVEMAVPVDHPWVLSFRFEWRNQKGSVLESVRANPTGGYDALGPRVGELARCFTKTFGAPKVTDTDYLKKKKSYSFTLPGGANIYLADTSLDLRAGWGDKNKLDQKTLGAFTSALDGCRP